MAFSTITPTKTWVAREGQLYLAPAHQITFSNTVTLSGAFSSAASGVAVQAAVKNVTVTPPETGWEKQDFLGTDTNSFQNGILDPKPPGLATITGTLIIGEDETIENIVVSGVSSIAGPSGYTRYQVGRNISNSLAAVVVLNTPDYTDYVAFAMDNARVTKWGDLKISGPDAHWEQDFTIVCLPRDFYYEFKD